MSTVVKLRTSAAATEREASLPVKVKLIGGLQPFATELFALEVEEEAPPFLRLVAEKEDLAFHVIEPFIVDENYSPTVRDEDCEELELTEEDKPLVLCLVNLSGGAAAATINLAGPLLFNLRTGRGKQLALGKQVIPLNVADFSPRRPLLPRDTGKGR